MTLLPDHPGLLPYWLLFTSALSAWNTIGCYRSRSHILRAYEGPMASSQITDFSARLSGTLTLHSCAIRTCAAYRLDNPDVYFLAWCTYAIALLHFGSESFTYGTMRPGKGSATMLMIATVGTIWMTVQRGFYLR